MVAATVLLVTVAAPVFSQEAEEEEDPALYAVGTLGASNLYSSYVVLATVADGYASTSYSGATARDLAEESIALHESSVEALDALVEADNLHEDDRRIIGEMIEAHELLVQQAEGLLAYVEEDGSSEEFQRHREAAWEKISEILKQTPPE
ncbi:MAG: hypothetical protein ACLFRR_01710 [Spirochaetaceae bacterium]